MRRRDLQVAEPVPAWVWLDVLAEDADLGVRRPAEWWLVQRGHTYLTVLRLRVLHRGLQARQPTVRGGGVVECPCPAHSDTGLEPSYTGREREQAATDWSKRMGWPPQ